MNVNLKPRSTWTTPVFSIPPSAIIGVLLGAACGHAVTFQYYLFAIPALLYFYLIVKDDKGDSAIKNISSFMSLTCIVASLYTFGLSLTLLPALLACKYGSRYLFWTAK